MRTFKGKTLVNFTTQPTSASILQELLARNPNISLHDIRRAHPVFRFMSMDQIGLRLSRAIHAQRDEY